MPVAAVPAMTPPKSYIQLTGLDGGPMARGLEPQQIRYWQAQQGESLRQVLKNWSEQAGVQLFWAEGQDYALPTAVQMHGTYQNAVTRVLQDFGGSFPQPLGQLHPNQPEGPPVLIIDHSA
jgi:hypothetical protein